MSSELFHVTLAFADPMMVLNDNTDAEDEPPVIGALVWVPQSAYAAVLKCELAAALALAPSPDINAQLSIRWKSAFRETTKNPSTDA